MIKLPGSLTYILKIFRIYEILKNVYLKHFKFLGILKDDIETNLFLIFLNTKKNTFVDIGANKGSKIDLALLVNRQTKIIAFEAFYKYYIFLKKKYKGNLQVSLFNKAIDKNISSKYFYYNNKREDKEAFSLIKNPRFNKKKKIFTSTVDKELENMKIDIIKIDVEGSEYNVLQRSKNIIANNKPVFFIEATHKTLFNIDSFLFKNNYLSFIYEYYIFKKKLVNNWIEGNVVTNDKFKKEIYTIEELLRIKNFFMVNLVCLHKSRISSLKKIAINNLKFIKY